MLRIVCQRCGHISGSIVKHNAHFCERKHQKDVRKSFLNWSEEDNLKSVVVYAPSKTPSPLPSVIMDMFQKLSVYVGDFVFWPETPKLFVVQTAYRDDVEKIFQLLRQQSDLLTIGGESIQIRRKSDVLQNEWSILIGEEMAKEGALTQPVIIDPDVTMEDEDSDSSVIPIPESTINQNVPVTTFEVMDCSEPELEASVETQEAQDEEPSVAETDLELKLTTKMTEKFVRLFHSKVKTEKPEKDDKRHVYKNLKCLEEKWIEIYLGFHDKIWPACFLMGNSDSEVETKIEKDVGLQTSFVCTYFPSEHNSWMGESINKDYQDLVDSKTEEFLEILSNETECNRRLKQLSHCRKEKDKHPTVLKFTCRIFVRYNMKHDTSAELTFTNISGTKQIKKRMEVVQAIFVNLFKSYEKMKIKKWSSAAIEHPLTSSKQWTRIIKLE